MSDDSKNDRGQSDSAEPYELLPWYVNGTLAEGEKARVERYLDESPAACQELAFLQQVAARSREDQPEPPGELGLVRLRRDIRRQKLGKGTMSGWWRPVAIAASLVLAIESGFLIWQQDVTTDYRPAGSAAAEVQITFVPQASEQNIRALLQQVGAEIVGGPGKLGVYHLSFDSSADIEQALARLRANDRVVSHASRS